MRGEADPKKKSLSLHDRTAERAAELVAVELLVVVLDEVRRVLRDRIEHEPLGDAVVRAQPAAPSSGSKSEPRNVLPPDFVTALMTPPSAPPYSASRPEVLTCTSWRYSKTASWRWLPWIRLTTETPSTVKLFSPADAPFTWKPPSSSPVLTDGSAAASAWKLRPFGMTSNSSAGMLR